MVNFLHFSILVVIMSLKSVDSKDYSITRDNGNDDLKISGSLAVKGHNEATGSLQSVGGGLAFKHESGLGASVQAHHIQGFGNQLTAGVHMKVLDTPDHKLNVDAFKTINQPMETPNFSVQGVNVDYSFKDKVGINAAHTHIPSINHKEYSVGGNINIHKTPSSSLDLNLGAYKTDNQFGSNSWSSGGKLVYRVDF